jgi:hypothetical protein
MKRGTAASAWAAGFLPSGVGGPATAALAASGAAEQAAGGRRAPPTAERAMWATAGCLAAPVGAVGGGRGRAGGTGLLLLNDLAVAIAGAVALTAAGGLWARGRAGALVVDLGARDWCARPVTDRLARALGRPGSRDPLRAPVRPLGRRAGPRGGGARRGSTRSRAPRRPVAARSRCCTERYARRPRLVAAATAAAALALDSARLDADVRAQSAEVRASRRRLLTAADRERRAWPSAWSAARCRGCGTSGSASRAPTPRSRRSSMRR